MGRWLDRGTGVQVISAGDTLIGLYLRDDYKEIAASNNTPGGGKTFRWDRGEATLNRTPDGGALLVVREVGKPQVSIPLWRK